MVFRKGSAALALLAVVTSGVWGATRDPSFAFGGGDVFGGDVVDYKVDYAPAQNGGPTITDHRATGQFTISRTDVDRWWVQQRVSHFGLGGPVVIPGGVSVPTSLWSLESGIGYARRFQNGRSMSLSASIGSDSDKPFHSTRETVGKAFASYRVPSGPRNAWLFLLTYSNNRHFFNNIPLPGIAYFMQTQDGKWRAIVGFPFASVRFAPTDAFDVRASLFGPRNLSLETGYRVKGPVRLYSGFEWGQQEWLRANRPNYNDRIFYDRKRLLVGVQTPLFAGLGLDLSGGREFDRRFYEHDSSSAKNVSVAGLPPAWILEAQLSFRFGPVLKPQVGN